MALKLPTYAIIVMISNDRNNGNNRSFLRQAGHPAEGGARGTSAVGGRIPPTS